MTDVVTPCCRMSQSIDTCRKYNIHTCICIWMALRAQARNITPLLTNLVCQQNTL